MVIIKVIKIQLKRGMEKSFWNILWASWKRYDDALETKLWELWYYWCAEQNGKQFVVNQIPEAC